MLSNDEAAGSSDELIKPAGTSVVDAPDSDALSIYMRQMGNSAVLSYEEETAYAKEYDSLIREFRRKLCHLAFVAKDHLSIVNDMTIEPIWMKIIALQSVVNECGDG